MKNQSKNPEGNNVKIPGVKYKGMKNTFLTVAFIQLL